jgi:GTP1/Obg family GTP-binding protein
MRKQAEVRKILNRCIDNLGKFANQLDNLNKFFRDIHDFVKRFNNDSVHRFMKSAETARKIIDKASSEDRERKKQQRLDVSDLLPYRSPGRIYNVV